MVFGCWIDHSLRIAVGVAILARLGIHERVLLLLHQSAKGSYAGITQTVGP